MSIKLRVAPYCEECPEFEPEPLKYSKEIFNKDPYERSYLYDHVVQCTHKGRCESMVGYLEDKMKGDLK